MAPNINHHPWRETKGPWLCLQLHYCYFVLPDSFTLFLGSCSVTKWLSSKITKVFLIWNRLGAQCLTYLAFFPSPGGEPRLEITLLVNLKDSPGTSLLLLRPVLRALLRYSPLYLSGEVRGNWRVRPRSSLPLVSNIESLSSEPPGRPQYRVHQIFTK